MNGRIKNVIFDIGNVLIDFCWRDHMVSLGFSGECIAMLTETMINSPLWDELDMGLRSHEDIIADMKAAAPQYAAQIDGFFGKPEGLIRMRPRSVPWLSGLKERGYGVYLLSNYPKWMFEIHSQMYDFMPYIDGKLVSSYVNLMKPDHAVYRMLLEKYSLKAEECAFVDDRPLNTAAAEELGIRSVTYVDAQQAESELEKILSEEQ